MKKFIIVLLLVAVLGMSGCADVPGYNDQDVIDEYNYYVDVWNADIGTHSAYLDKFGDAIDKYDEEVQSYNNAYWDDGSDVADALEELEDAQFNYKTNALAVKGRLEMFRTFLYTNKSTLERNGIDVQGQLNDINEWIAEIDYNLQFAGI